MQSNESLGVLCLGFSNIVQRRVLPALEALPGVARFEIASRRGRPEETLLTPKCASSYDDFEAALASSRCDLVYVSTVNSEHEAWAERALERGFHVVVDKPAFLELEAGDRLLRLASSRRLCLAEATVYAAHPQIELCRQIFAEAGLPEVGLPEVGLPRVAARPTRITTLFSMPPLPPDNFRYQRQLGGGALWDLGPYAVSLGRVFFGEPPETVHASVLSRGGPDRVATAFSAQLTYSEGRSLVGHFGFDTEYRNEATLLGPGAAVRISRLFTTPPNYANTLEVHAGNQASQRQAPAADSFACFLGEVLDRIRDGGDYADFGQHLRDDLQALVALRRAAETGGGR
ncbi:MAG: Gfo/Idh/MocA family oxidoreductase [Acidobacteriota bacterium]